MSSHVSTATRNTLLLSILSLAGTTFALLQAIIVPALPEIQHAIGTSATGAAWLLTANLLSTAIFTPVLGRAGDLHGKDRILIVVLALLGLGTLICALGDSLPVMLAGRALQGAGGAVYPLAFGIVRDELPADRVAGAIGLVSSLLGIGAGLGLAIAGPVVSVLSYHWLFWLPLAVLAPTTVLAHRFVPKSTVRTPGTINRTATAVMAAGLTAVLIAVSMTPRWGWLSMRTVGLAALGAVLIVAWVTIELHAAEPLVDMRVLRNRAVWATNLAAFLLGFGMYAVIVLIPELVELPHGVGLGESVTAAGVFMLPTALPQLVVGPLTGRIQRRIGSRAQLQLGLLAILAGYAQLAAAHSTAWELLCAGTAVGIGLGLGLGALGNLIVSNVDRSQTGVATGVNAVFRTLGGALGSQVVASIVLGSGALATTSGFALAFVACALAAALGLGAAAAIPAAGGGTPKAVVIQAA